MEFEEIPGEGQKIYRGKLIGFSINNFRVFGIETNFGLSPITLLTGTNNSGKSSFIKALLLLQKSFFKNGLLTLDLMDTNLKLGDLDSIYNFTSNSEKIKFDLIFEQGKFFNNSSGTTSKIRISICFKGIYLESFSLFDKNDELLMEANGDSKNLKYFKLSNSFFRLNRKIINTKKLKTKFEYLNDEEFETLTEYLYYYLQNCIDVHTHNDDFFEYDNPNVIEAHERNVIHSLKNIGIDPDSNWFANPQIKDVLPKRFWKKISGNDHEVYISQFLQLTKVNSISDDNEFNLLDDFSPTLSFYEGIISSLLKSMDFIGAVRGKHEVVFTRENTPQNTFDAIEKFANQTHPPTEILEYWMVTRLKIITLKNKQQFNDVFKIKRIAGFGYMLCFKIDNKEIDITSFGYGVMQLLPVLLKLAMHRGSLLVIEEPEANLHPAFQSKLADIFLDAIQKYGFTLIIETHSEYLIRKLQFLTASITSKLKPADTVIYYFYPPNEIPEGEPQIKKINIQDDGSLSDEFGTGFFDEADNIAMELFLLKQSQKN